MAVFWDGIYERTSGSFSVVCVCLGTVTVRTMVPNLVDIVLHNPDTISVNADNTWYFALLVTLFFVDLQCIGGIMCNTSVLLCEPHWQLGG